MLITFMEFLLQNYILFNFSSPLMSCARFFFFLISHLLKVLCVGNFLLKQVKEQVMGRGPYTIAIIATRTFLGRFALSVWSALTLTYVWSATLWELKLHLTRAITRIGLWLVTSLLKLTLWRWMVVSTCSLHWECLHSSP